MYYRTKGYYLFLFTLINDSEKFERKQTFFFVRKTLAQVEELSQDNHKTLITHDQDIYIVKENDLCGSDEIVLQKYLQIMNFRELVELQKEKQDNHLHLTFETLFDMRQRIEFLPFIYQEKNKLATNQLLILDVNSMQIVGKTCINSNLQIRQYLRKSLAGFNMYTLTRTSDIFDQKLGFFEKMRGNAAEALS